MELLIVAAMIVGGFAIMRWMGRSLLKTGDTLVNQTELTTMAELDSAFDASRERATVVFLHDPWCPISAMASHEVNQLEFDILGIDVSSQHDLKEDIERRTGVRHESPQVIVLKDGVAVWDASHGSIQLDAIERELAEQSATQTG